MGDNVHCVITMHPVPDGQTDRRTNIVASCILTNASRAKNCNTNMWIYYWWYAAYKHRSTAGDKRICHCKIGLMK